MTMIATVHPFNKHNNSNTSTIANNFNNSNNSSGFKIEDVTDDPKVFFKLLKMFVKI